VPVTRTPPAKARPTPVARRAASSQQDDALADALEHYRDGTFRRLPRLRITSERAALEFINRCGFCAAFTAGLGVPCLREAIAGEREPVLPEHIQHDHAVMMTWRIKDSLPARGAVYYGKVVGGRPGFIALDMLPAFLKLRAPAAGYRILYKRGILSRCAWLVMDALSKSGPADTRTLKLASGYTRPRQRPEFDRAMAELQEKFLALKVEERYDPFTYVWDTFERHFETALTESGALSRDDAARRIVERYFEIAGFGAIRDLARLVAIDPKLVERAARRLEREGIVKGGVRIGRSNSHFVLARLMQS
jgi:hypothetical protein